MKIYIIYNKTENRPLIQFGNYGAMIVFLTEEQAKAYVAGNEDVDKKLSIEIFEI